MRLYCNNCKLYPNIIKRRYIETTEDVLVWNEKDQVYTFNTSNHPCGIPEADGINEIEPKTIELCGICDRKLVKAKVEEDLLDTLF